MYAYYLPQMIIITLNNIRISIYKGEEQLQKKRKEVLYLVVDYDLKDELQQYANLHQWSMTSVARMILKQGLQERSIESKQLRREVVLPPYAHE